MNGENFFEIVPIRVVIFLLMSGLLFFVVWLNNRSRSERLKAIIFAWVLFVGFAFPSYLYEFVEDIDKTNEFKYRVESLFLLWLAPISLSLLASELIKEKDLTRELHEKTHKPTNSECEDK